MELLLGIILFFILFYYLFRFFLRYGLPWILARFVRKQQEKYNQQNQYNSTKDGEVRIKNSKPKKGKDDSGFGEYVDYEDVNDN